jgi:small-conductance mechanosensitive channel
MTTTIDRLFSAPWWQSAFLSNPLQDYAIALVVLMVLLVVFKLLEKVLLARLSVLSRRTATDIDNALVEIVRSIHPRFYVIASVWVAPHVLVLSTFAKAVIDAVAIVAVGYQLAHSLQILINFITRKKVDDPTQKSALHLIGSIAKIVLWVFALLVVLSNLGVNITSLVAGLGIGGIAVALAVQGILSDLFSSFSIYFDKPFEVGDFVVVGDIMGTVEKVGVKTTRIASLQGEEVVISNQDLTSARIRNYKKMERRRAVFSFGVVYDTPQELLVQIPDMIKDVIESQELTEFDRCHFHAFGDSALEFETVYYIATGEYGDYMDVHQAIHLEIKKVFEEKGIDMAFPTRTVHVVKK